MENKAHVMQLKLQRQLKTGSAKCQATDIAPSLLMRIQKCGAHAVGPNRLRKTIPLSAQILNQQQ
jgi:hypothetical protein